MRWRSSLTHQSRFRTFTSFLLFYQLICDITALVTVLLQEFFWGESLSFALQLLKHSLFSKLLRKHFQNRAKESHVFIQVFCMFQPCLKSPCAFFLSDCLTLNYSFGHLHWMLIIAEGWVFLLISWTPAIAMLVLVGCLSSSRVVQ